MNQIDILFQEILGKCNEVELLRRTPNFRWGQMVELDLQIMQLKLAEVIQIDPSITELIKTMNIVSREHDETFFRELNELYKAMFIEIQAEELPLFD